MHKLSSLPLQDKRALAKEFGRSAPTVIHPRVREPALTYRATMGIVHEVRSPEDLHSPEPLPTLHP